MVYEIENESNKLVLLGCAVWWTDGKHAHLGYGGAHHRDRQIDGDCREEFTNKDMRTMQKSRGGKAFRQEGQHERKWQFTRRYT